MKKITKVLLTLLLALALLPLVGCKNDAKVITVGATPAPHAQILEEARAYIESQGYTLKIVVFTDYVQPNIALDDGDLDANYFQHIPYLTNFCAEHDLDLSSAAKIHFEPLGIYQGGKGTTLSALEAGDNIYVPDDATNCARALQLLAANNVIEITNDKGLETTVADCDTKGINVTPLEAGTIASSIADASFAVINGNYAVDWELQDKLVAQEDSTSEAYSTYANIVAVKTEDLESEKTKVLVEALQQPNIKQYIEDTYDGAVVFFDAD